MPGTNHARTGLVRGKVITEKNQSILLSDFEIKREKTMCSPR